MRRNACAVCAGELTDFLDLGSTPLADVFPADASVPEKWYPLQVAVCTSCWLAQLRDVVPDEELYGSDYGFRTGSSPGLVRYFEKLAWGLLKRYDKCAVAEIGCNDGTLLRYFADAGCPVIGIDPSGAAAEADEELVLPAPFTLEIAKQVTENRGMAGLVLAFNVAAHVADPLDFFAGVRELLADDGVAVVEFQDFAALAAGCQYDHVYHEHRFFYSLGSFAAAAARCGLSVADWERTPSQGGSVRVHLRPSRVIPYGSNLPSEPWLLGDAVYAGMQDRADFAKRRLLELVGGELNEGRVIAGYGASAKSCTLFNFCRLGPRNVQWVEDLTPGKIGRVTPGSCIPVRGPGPVPDTFLATSWNYLSHMVRNEEQFLVNGGRIIVPGAVPVIL